MSYIVLDTETSGIMDYKRPANAEGQPRVAEVALIYLDDDLNIEREFRCYVKPSGWDMSPEATAIHGLTYDFLEKRGEAIEVSLDVYTQAIREGRAVVAYGAQFDCKMMRAELRRAGRDDLFEQTPNICIMRSLLSHAKQTGRRLLKYDILTGDLLEGAKGWAKLYDACRYYGIPIPPARTHSALADARAAAKIFTAMVAEGFDRTPEVHHAKDYDAIKERTS